MVLYQTVEDLLHAAGTSRKFPASVSGDCGDQSDHVIELQLIKHALNKVGAAYAQPDLNTLVRFFNSAVNHQCLTREENNKKGAAIGRYIQMVAAQPGDDKFIIQVQNKWIQLRQKPECNSRTYTNFVTKMNEILRC